MNQTEFRLVDSQKEIIPSEGNGFFSFSGCMALIWCTLIWYMALCRNGRFRVWYFYNRQAWNRTTSSRHQGARLKGPSTLWKCGTEGFKKGPRIGQSLGTLRKLYFHSFSHWMGYDRGDSFPFDFEPSGFPFGSKSNGKLSPWSYPIQCERKWKYSFLSVQIIYVCMFIEIMKVEWFIHVMFTALCGSFVQHVQSLTRKISTSDSY